MGGRTQVCQVMAGGNRCPACPLWEKMHVFFLSHPQWGQELWKPRACRWNGMRWSKGVKTTRQRESVPTPEKTLSVSQLVPADVELCTPAVWMQKPVMCLLMGMLS